MKKTMILLLLAMLLPLTACTAEQPVAVESDPVVTEAPTEPEIVLTLKDTGGCEIRGGLKLTNMGPVNGDPTFLSSGVLIDHLNEKVKLLDLNGNPHLAKDYDGVAAVLGNGICIAVDNIAYGLDLYGIVNVFTGEEIAPCEAIEVIPLSDRYILMNYIDELTTEKPYYGSFYRNDRKLYYIGHGLVLDLEKKRFVPNLQITDSKKHISALEDLIVLEGSHHSVREVYNAEGELLGSYVNLITSATSKLAFQVLPDNIQIYNSNMEPLSLLPGKIYDYAVVPGSSHLLIKNEIVEDQPCAYVINLNGEAQSASCSAISEVYEGKYICHRIIDEKTDAILYGVMDFSGEILVPAEYTSMEYVEPGYFLAQNAEGYFMYDTTGRRCNDTPLSHHRFSPMLYQDGHEKMLILDTGEIYESKQYPEYMCLSLVLTDGKLIDLITGQTVMEQVDSCFSLGNNLYVWDPEATIYTRYTVEYADANI